MAITTPNNLRQLRRAAGLQGKEIAARLGITPDHYSRVENGKAELTPAVAKKSAEILGVHMKVVTGEQQEQDEFTPRDLKFFRWMKALPDYKRKAVEAVIKTYRDQEDETE